MIKQVELRRHTDNEGDVLTPEGVAAAIEIGRSLQRRYQLVVSSGAQRATQTAACLLAGLGEEVPGGVIVEPGLRSRREENWKAAYRKAGKGDLGSLREADPDLVTKDSAELASGLRRVFEQLNEGQTAIAIGHSPTSEAAIFGLTGVQIDPLGKGEGVLVIQEGEEFSVRELD